MINTEIDTLIRTWITPHEPGAAVAFIKDEQIVHCQGYGLANLEWEQPITPHTAFALASLTKPFTATVIMLLEKAGKLRLDNPIQAYLPDYPKHEYPITLMHLLTHTSGIPNFVTLPGFWKQHAQVITSIDEVIALFKDLPLDFTPGTNYSYSNSGYLLLGHIIETLTDMSYADAIRTQIFHPLGMSHSFYPRHDAIIPYRASGYMRTNQEYLHAPSITDVVKYAAGGLGSTVEDLMRWDTALRKGQLLDHTIQERMYTPVQLADGHKENYGLGWGIGRYRQHKFICHAGGIPGFSTFFGRFPDDHVSIIILSNRGDFDCAGLARKMVHVVLELPAPIRIATTPDAEVLSKVLGTYSSVYGTVEVKEEEQTLYLCRASKHALVPMSETSFYQADDEDIEIHFEKQDEHGNYKRIRIIQPFFWFTAERAES